MYVFTPVAIAVPAAAESVGLTVFHAKSDHDAAGSYTGPSTQCVDMPRWFHDCHPSVGAVFCPDGITLRSPPRSTCQCVSPLVSAFMKSMWLYPMPSPMSTMTFFGETPAPVSAAIAGEPNAAPVAMIPNVTPPATTGRANFPRCTMCPLVRNETAAADRPPLGAYGGEMSREWPGVNGP